MILTFTGPRIGMTDAQRAALPGVLAAFPTTVVHGGAEGADTQFDRWLAARTRQALEIEVHPASRSRYNYWAALGPMILIRRRVLPYDEALRRNRSMVGHGDCLLACPATPHEVVCSGTWACVRAARKLGRPIVLIMPDGSVVEEER